MTETLEELGYDDTRHDPDDALRVLLEQQHLIAEMQRSQGWKLWADFLAALAVGYQNRLLRGRHSDIMDVKFDAGVCEGLRLALTAPENLDARINAARLILAEDTLADEGERDEAPPV
jgi:hypothetical protein